MNCSVIFTLNKVFGVIDALLKKVMRECKLRQPELAEVLGTSLDRVKSLTSGRVKNLTREESEALIGKLDIRADWLITGEGPMFQYDEETQDEFVNRMQAIKRLGALINAMPLSQITRMRLSIVMTGDAEQDGRLLFDAITAEARGLDFVTGAPIDGALGSQRVKSPDAQLWAECYDGFSPEVKKRELRRAMGVSPSGQETPEPKPDAPLGANSATPSMGNNNQVNSALGAVQIKGSGNSVRSRSKK